YDDAFFIDRDNESVTWMYYNPDSNAGGQYVTNTLSFDEIQQAAQEYDSAEDFFDYLGSIANQELADVGSEWFEDAESQFSQQPDFTDCTKATMQSLVAAVSEVPVYDRETKILYSVLGRLKIDDIELGYDENGLVARDGDNEWHGAEFYHFLVDEACVFEDDGSVLGIRPDLLDDFKVLSEHNGVEVKDDRNKEPEPIVPAWEQKKKSKVTSFDLHPDIPMSERHNFDLANNQVEEVNKKERFHRNYAAIKVLKDCQNENRFATPDEQKILSRYVGWGGIPEAFDERAGAWHTEYAMLKNTLTPEEYVSARESTLTAFYTPPEVSTAIYKVLEQMGFQEGNLLEPSCGIGNFIGMLPKSMENAKVYGVELDTVSAGIAQQLYQKSSIAAQGFEEVNVPDSFFDGVIGNVPFGDFKVSDKRYDKYNFLIHDYFFAKSLDKLRPGGVMALVTSKGTMDKENSNVRKYIAQRAELLGAIRLPNDTFKGNAGTEVVSDILFLQKRDRLIDIEPDWVHLDTDENGIRMNSYFIQHPEMILGEMKMASGRFGPEATCEPFDNADLSELLNEAVSNIHGEISEYEVADELEEEDNTIPADPTVRNFSYTVLDDKIYFRENSRMSPVEVSATAENRIKGMIGIRDCVRNLIELQTEDYPDSEIKQAQEKLNTLYDSFTKKYGLINSRANTSAFSDDSSYALLSALEVINEDGELERKADMFFKRTIKPHKPVTEVDTADEALAVSMGEKAAIDMAYMMELSGKSEEELFSDLKGVIFLNPLYEYGNSYEPKYLMADEYLSGNVREKLATAKRSATLYPEDYTVNVQALEKVQPKDLTASEISVRLGATWIPPEIFQQFMFEFLDTPRYAQWNIKVHYSQFTGEWNIEGKSYDRSNVKAYSTYGTSRINAYKIIEETLNLKDVRIFDYIEDEEGRKKAVLNKKETAIAQAKQELIKQGFQDWIWADPTRREKLTKMYNEKFNSIRPREYDGSHIVFNGMNPEIELREHQKNAVAHILYGGNTLLAHAVGAGKTFEMVAAAMESKRLGLCNKSLFVVPNHLTEQWAAEFLQLYPAANILVATKRDFETKNRKKFCGRIATGDYDAVIIGHSQFEKIPMSIERQRAILEQ
ncbi:N-6 DNA methylase, partial [Butyricicoccus intestinisimiae]|uniref:N-6 DNA methylase n=1 Tax=Butyricicoccus intestinisimiae TaxID=2841509 RepID=UPI003D8DE037